MQFNININQEKLSSTKLDLIDAAILEYVYHLCSSVSEEVERKRITDPNGNKYTWVNYDTLIEEMPLLKIKRKGALTPRFKLLVSEGFIATKKGAGNQQFVRLLPNVSSLYREVTKAKTESSEFTKMNSRTNEPKTTEPEFTKMNSRIHQNEFQNSPKRTLIYDYYTKDSNTKDSRREEESTKHNGLGVNKSSWPSCPLNQENSLLREKYPRGHIECEEYITSTENQRRRGFANRKFQTFKLHDLLSAGFDFGEVDRLMVLVEKKTKAVNQWDFETLVKWADKEGGVPQKGAYDQQQNEYGPRPRKAQSLLDSL
jgi:hypothetical protein